MHHFRILTTCLLWALFMTKTMAGSILKGDANSDGVVSVVDVMLTVNYILHQNDDVTISLDNADINDDNEINVVDIMLCVNIILNKVEYDDPTPPTDGDDAIPGYPVLSPHHPK